MGRLKKKNKLSLPCDQDIGSSAIAIFAIHTCFKVFLSVFRSDQGESIHMFQVYYRIIIQRYQVYKQVKLYTNLFVG